MKKLFAFLLAVVLCLSFTACSEENSSDSDSKKDKNKEETESVVTDRFDDETENDEFKNNETENDEVYLELTGDNVISKGDTITTDTYEFTVEDVNITAEVKPYDTSSYYSYYAAKDGKVYVDICILYKNTDNIDVTVGDVLSGTLIFNGKYEYSGFSVLEQDNRSDFTSGSYEEIIPLASEYLHYLFSVPDYVNTSGGSIVLKMNIGGDDYNLRLRDGKVEIIPGTTNKKKSGSISAAEAIATKKSEFSLESVNITNDVLPSDTNGVYSHYEADSGKVYVVACFNYKNTDTKSADVESVFDAKLIYEDKYEYTGFAVLEDDDHSGFDSFGEVNPLCTEKVYYLFEVPDEIQNGDGSIKLKLTIDGNKYTYTARS